MKTTQMLLVAGATTALTSLSSAMVTLIGGDVRNGNLNDLTGAMQLDGVTTSAADTQADGSRAANSNNNIPSNVTIPFWTANRAVTNMGGNAFFGFDDSTGTPLGGVVGGSADRAFLYNNGEVAGAVDLIHDDFNSGFDFQAGDTFTLTYQLATDDAVSDVTNTPQLTIGGTLLTPTSLTATGTATTTATSVSLAGADALTAVTATYTLAAAAADPVISLVLDNAVQVDNGGVDRATIDNIVLITSVPEPSTALLGGLATLGLLRRRR